ncbi:MAG: VacJ family lipoprotein, partial [Victivallales bacterium]|nr:VacJ family lipoprotein [Victivallales bacterium]
YIPQHWTRLGINAGKQVNHVSLSLGEYERSKAAALDHYVSLRDLYEQYRERQIAE